MITTEDFDMIVHGWVPNYNDVPNYEDEEDDWAMLFERDDRSDVYEMFDGLRNDCN